ncbi:MAG TPA: IS1182 family transposase [Thermoanaerobaculia bacterium]|nr:IS1182 family transposase [Thermoanaerobaculia bacterium]
MPTSFRPYAPDQSLLLPPSPRDWLPEGHLAYFISETVDTLDLSAFYAPYEGDGRRNQPFEPAMMVKVLLYAYATGTFSSRRIARKLEEDVAYRVLAVGNFPAHRTICEFRQEHLKAFGELFVQVVRIAREAGVVRMGSLVVDGSKVKANASKRKAMSYGRMLEEERRLQGQIAELTARAAAVDAAEDAEHGPERRGDELPAELQRREQRLSKIREAKARLEARQAEQDRQKGRSEDDDRKSPRGGRPFARDFGVPPDKAQDNFTDPESRIMNTTQGFEQCYNGQIAVDEGSQMILATSLTNNAADHDELIPLLEQAQSNLGCPAQQVLADAGYRSEATFQTLEARGIDAYISLGREGTESATVSAKLEATRRMAEKLASSSGKQRYRRRKAVVEPVIGWIKSVLGFRHFSFRGQGKAVGEWALVCLAVNLKRYHVLQAA